jgi:hypothetical protein
MKLIHLFEEEQKLSSIIDIVRRDCQPYLQALDKPLFRGILTNKSKSLTKIEDGFYKGDVRKDRKPKDSSLEFHNLLDQYFEEKSGIKFRSNSLFCSFKRSVTGGYGDAFLIFPIGDFSYAWSPIFEDPYDEIYNSYIEHWNLPDKPYEYAQRVAKDMKIDAAGNESLPVFKKVLGKFGDQLFNINKNINQAIGKDNEIMLHCNSYYAVDTSLMSDYRVRPFYIFDEAKK